ncbi:MAG: hypothetical protein DLM57_12130 [Pseudonocardiales bacterium]|nr:MAG: hypothetical protein DLM57_12130 [Pseudonocardiales bacterium]
MTVKTARRYHAPARTSQARQTRARILVAARELFERRGFAATMGEVADAAGVSVGTVELGFKTKGALLDAVVDVAIAGDDEPVSLFQRSWATSLEDVDAQHFLSVVAGIVAEVAVDVAPLLLALDQAAPTDTRIAALNDRLTRQRMQTASWVVQGLVRRGALADDLSADDAVQTALLLLDPIVHRRLLIQQGWDRPRLERFLRRSFRRLLGAPSREPASSTLRPGPAGP